MGTSAEDPPAARLITQTLFRLKKRESMKMTTQLTRKSFTSTWLFSALALTVPAGIAAATTAERLGTLRPSRVGDTGGG